MAAVADQARIQQPVFYYDLADPDCYLVGEQVSTALGVVPEWEPVLSTDIQVVPPGLDRRRIEERAAELGLQPVRWPEQWPPDNRDAILAATYAKHIGRVVAFSLAAFRQVFAGGGELGDRDTILIAGAACEMHPSALIKGMSLRSVSEGLRGAEARARAAGVASLPAIQVGESVFEGAGAIAEAADALAAEASR